MRFTHPYVNVVHCEFLFYENMDISYRSQSAENTIHRAFSQCSVLRYKILHKSKYLYNSSIYIIVNVYIIYFNIRVTFTYVKTDSLIICR